MEGKYALIGEKLSHSISKEIHELIMEHLKVKGTYTLKEINEEEFYSSVRDLKEKFQGINVTIPYKKDIIKTLDFVSDEAKAIGAVNTVVFRDNKSYGYNTDYYGFLYSLRVKGIDVSNKECVVLGSGGAALAIFNVLKDLNANKIYIVTRGEAKEGFNGGEFISYDKLKAMQKSDILINCTPLGMYPNVDFAPIEKRDIEKFNTVVDIVYNPLKTKLLKEAESLNIKTLNGLYMLVAQAVYAEELFLKIKIDEENILEIYEKVKGLVE